MKESNNFKNKIVLVTGSARGLGKSIAQEFVQKGAIVILCDKDLVRGKQTEKELKKIHKNCEFLACDLSKDETPKQLIKEIVNRFSKLDILVNNAKSGQRYDFESETSKTWDETISVTLKAAFFVSQAAILEMRKNGSGKIVNIASVEAETVSRGSPSYHIAKAGIVQMTRYLAVNAAKFKININCVAPGFIIQDEHYENFNKPANAKYRKIAEFTHPGGHPGRAINIADSVLFLSSAQADFINGQCLTVDGSLIIQEPSKLLYDFEKFK